MNPGGSKLTRRNAYRIPKTAVGIATVLEFSINFIRWAERQPRPISAAAIESNWGMSRATAYRWRAAYLASTGQYVETHQFKRGK